ncbi:hypothetical protein JW887_04935 [Candidatus Dojkabacteria bacterium]|nr:hypothetical protein [Candidatus Dojkabacteria bacterium]
METEVSIKDLAETNRKGNAAILMVKPCGVTTLIGGHSVQELILGMITSAQLEIVMCSQRRLNEHDVRGIYRILNIPDPVYGEAWKYEVISHLTSSDVFSYLVLGDDAVRKTRLIKNHVRQALADPSSYHSKVVENMAHVVDSEDFETSFNILFGVA